MGFRERLLSTARRNDSWLCVGLDPDPKRFPTPASARDFLVSVVNETRDFVCSYKPNAAFFEAMGPEGVEVLRELIAHATRAAPVILDAKRGDIGNTAEAYARWAFDVMRADATTVSPYMGWDSVEPFYRRGDRGVFILARTSNPGAADVQSLRLESGELLYERVARLALAWPHAADVGLVAGATAPDELARLRSIAGEETFLLVPGVGAQGGSAVDAIRRGGNARGDRALVVAARSVLNAPKPAEAAMALRAELNAARPR